MKAALRLNDFLSAYENRFLDKPLPTSRLLSADELTTIRGWRDPEATGGSHVA